MDVGVDQLEMLRQLGACRAATTKLKRSAAIFVTKQRDIAAARKVAVSLERFEAWQAAPMPVQMVDAPSERSDGGTIQTSHSSDALPPLQR